LVGTGVLGYDPASLFTSSTETANDAAGREKAATTRTAALTDERKSDAARKAADPSQPSFDIVRLDPDSFSVFAGKAPPNSTVTVLANGRAIATTKASETGDWSIVVEHPFAAGEYQLSLTAKAESQTAAVQGQAISMSVAKGARVTLADAKPVAKTAQTPVKTTAPGGDKRDQMAAAPGAKPAQSPAAVKELERMVVSARGGDKEQRAVSLPVPITFVYDEPNFTAEGQKAAALLAEYLQLRRLDNVVLSGHADERGSDQYNMELSQLRLERVARFLRDNGYKGQLSLLPKGKSEPYAGIDRSHLPKEQVFQLDRRVELHLTR
jgi:outer membrane protein OmpA-like peptidoglycan-associated protein